ncbi:hypothetical protein M3090_10450 [Bacteroides sp. ET71]|uniref:hypothetical protein n=1 Tax=Bacteroides sp. ET71 TaxID=2939421 RepID=UPI00201229AA|nr:hypothetical protein [Bacteroides sp. ET71]MCL1616807.1 hypothetical protein [Bacteroides sp. ET71]
MTRKTKKLVYNTVIVCLLLAGLAYVCARFVHPVVEAIADATGAAVSLIPQDNATGNFVKVEREMWSYRHLVPVLLLIFVVEVLFSTERVLEEAYLGEVMGYAEMVSVRLDGAVLAGGVVGSALLGEGMRRAVAGGVARVSGWVDRAGVVPGVGDGAVADGFMRQMSEAGLKQMYGWALYASVALLLLLLLYDAPVRRGLKLMPLWTRLRREAEG